MKKIFSALLLGVFVFTIFSASAMAQSGDGSGTPGSSGSKVIINIIKVDTFSQLVEQLISDVVVIAFPFLILAFIYVGFLFVQAQGNADKIGEARSALLWTVVGAFILLGSWGFSKVLENTVKTLQ